MGNEITTMQPGKSKELQEQLPEVPSPATEIPDLTTLVKITEITDGKLDDYTQSLHSLVTKYSKSTNEKK